MAFPIEPPVTPMLSKAQPQIPEGEGWLYEPKWDGFRAIVFRDKDHFEIASRNSRPLNRYFPELIEPLGEALPPRCVVDGEIVIAGERGLDFDALLLRIHPAASRVQMLSEAQPASFVAFDMLADEHDLRDAPLTERVAHLRAPFTARPSVFLTPQTQDVGVARDWFVRYEGAGLDGIIAKRHDLRYKPGERSMVKVKHLRTADCVVGGYRLSKTKDGIGSLLLGIYRDGGLEYVGHTSSFKAAERRELLDAMRSIAGNSGFGWGRTPGGPSRWAPAEEKEWEPVKPRLVCEVAFDHMQGDRFRHGATFLRWRPDKDPEDCTWDQLEPPNPFDLDEIRRLAEERSDLH